MSADVADPPAPPSPTRSQSIQLRWRAVQRSTVLPVTMAALVALALGLYAGRATAPAVDEEAIAAVQREVLPLVVDADAIWTAGSDQLPPVGEQLYDLRASGDAAAVEAYLDGWLESYDTVLRRIVGVEVPATVRPVQRQFATAVTLSRDAVELIAAAAQVTDSAAQRELTSEAVRVRVRAEQVTQSAQAALTDLRGGGRAGVSVPPSLPSLADLR